MITPTPERGKISPPLTVPRAAARLSAAAGTPGGHAIPAKPKTKRTAKVSAKAKREAIAETFGNVPVDSEIIDFYYSRRSLATASDGKWRELKRSSGKHSTESTNATV
jgi:hypothetical protein